MKKKPIILTSLAFALILSACGKAAEPISAAPDETGVRTAVEKVITSVLSDPVMVYEETADTLKANGGANIGTESDQRKVTDEGVQFYAADGENPFMMLAKGLSEADGVNNMNQAFYIRFKPSAKDFGFMLSSATSVGITIGDDAEPCVFILEHDYMEPMATSLQIEPDNWYHALVAMSSDGVLQGALWKDGGEDNVARFSVATGSFDDGGYVNQPWQALIGYKGEATFTVGDYAYYTFAGGEGS